MTTTPPRPTGPLRPPAPVRGLASVSRLSPSHGEGVTPLEAVQGTLALDLGEPAGLLPRPLPHLSIASDEAMPDSELRTWAARFAQAVVEVTGGDRPLSQLLRWTSPSVYHDLGRRVQVMAQTRPAPQRRRMIRPQVRSVHVFQPEARCAEVSVHVRYGPRSRAIAARLERRRGSWTCTVLELG